MSPRNLDDEICKALTVEDQRLLAELNEEPPLFEVAIRSMSDRYRFFNGVGAGLLVILVAFGVISLWQFYHATELKQIVGWSLATMYCVTTIGMVKIWFWILINRHDTTREVKRLELQVARLAEAVQQKLPHDSDMGQ